MNGIEERALLGLMVGLDGLKSGCGKCGPFCLGWGLVTGEVVEKESDSVGLFIELAGFGVGCWLGC